MNKIVSVLVWLSLLVVASVLKAEVPVEIKHAVASKERAQSDKSRDQHRKPAEILALAGLKPGMKVVDLLSGGGYYTDIISRVVGDKGQVIAHNAPYVVNRFANFFNDQEKGWPAKFRSPQWKKNVVKSIEELDTINLPVQLDVALMVLFYHDTVWQGVNRDMMNRRIFNALKPGGAYVIVDHSAKAGSGIKDVKKLHRIDKQFVIDEITKVGFKLEADSNLLSHPEDTRDYIFTRDRQTRRDQTDRMVLKFVKPAE
ncbi:class I SAM-dependent methyltransferase [Aliikangiella coralliicola]|nr:class I SAM-dependent methyltransferase [Aliikangiella coralliicola]